MELMERTALKWWKEVMHASHLEQNRNENSKILFGIRR